MDLKEEISVKFHVWHAVSHQKYIFASDCNEHLCFGVLPYSRKKKCSVVMEIHEMATALP